MARSGFTRNNHPSDTRRLETNMKNFLMCVAIAAPIFAQDHIAVPLTDPGRPVTLSIHLLRGSITVRGYSGRELLVDTKGATETRTESTHEGMHRISGSGTDVTIESENNKVSISSHGMRSNELVVQ